MFQNHLNELEVGKQALHPFFQIKQLESNSLNLFLGNIIYNFLQNF